MVLGARSKVGGSSCAFVVWKSFTDKLGEKLVKLLPVVGRYGELAMLA
jgi:hypothetical protein